MSELVDALEEFAGELAVEGYEGKFNLIHQAAERIAELEEENDGLAHFLNRTRKALEWADGDEGLIEEIRTKLEARALLKGQS